MWFVIVSRNSLDIVHCYEADAEQPWGGEWGNPQAFIHLPVPDGLARDTVVAVKDFEGNILLQEDPTKVQAKLAQAWADLRAQRNARLAACDWTQLPDAHLSQDKKDAWAEYRQALRDLPQKVTDPMNVTWPLSLS